jgi:hypothetical protein
MKQLLTILFILSVGAVYGQKVQLKKNYGKQGHASLSFKLDGVKGSFKGSNEALELTIKNTADLEMDLSIIPLALIDASGRGAKLCVLLEACNGRDGLFMLDKKYLSKRAYEEDAFFLINKEWQLRIGGKTVTFYTDL